MPSEPTFLLFTCCRRHSRLVVSHRQHISSSQSVRLFWPLCADGSALRFDGQSEGGHVGLRLIPLCAHALNRDDEEPETPLCVRVYVCVSLLKTETPQCCSSAAPPLRLVFTRPSVKPMWASPIHTSCEMPTGGASRNHYTRSLCPTEHRKQAVLFKGQLETHKPPLSLDWEQREPQTHMCSNAAEIWSRRRGSCEGSRSSNKSWRAIKETHTHTSI